MSSEVKTPVEDVDSDEEIEIVPALEEKVEEVVEDTTLANSDVVTKYQDAARIVQAALIEISSLVSESWLTTAVFQSNSWR